jgi:hypothetical protein
MSRGGRHRPDRAARRPAPAFSAPSANPRPRPAPRHRPRAGALSPRPRRLAARPRPNISKSRRNIPGSACRRSGRGLAVAAERHRGRPRAPAATERPRPAVRPRRASCAIVWPAHRLSVFERDCAHLGLPSVGVGGHRAGHTDPEPSRGGAETRAAGRSCFGCADTADWSAIARLHAMAHVPLSPSRNFAAASPRTGVGARNRVSASPFRTSDAFRRCTGLKIDLGRGAKNRAAIPSSTGDGEGRRSRPCSGERSAAPARGAAPTKSPRPSLHRSRCIAVLLPGEGKTLRLQRECPQDSGQHCISTRRK